jgi:hypothetical protein
MFIDRSGISLPPDRLAGIYSELPQLLFHNAAAVGRSNADTSPSRSG